MHLFGRPQDGVNRAGLDAKRAPNAEMLLDARDPFFFVFASFFIKRFGLAIKQVSEGLNCGFTSWRAAIDVCLSSGNRLGVGAATPKPALTALGLRQQCVNLINHRIALDLEPNRGVPEQQTEYRRQKGNRDNSA